MQRFLFFKVLTIILISVTLFSCSKGELKRNPTKFNNEDLAHLLNLKEELATGNKFYIELSLRDREFRICHSGVTLKSYKFLSAKIKKRKILFLTFPFSIKWNNTIMRGLKIFPNKVIERVEIIPGKEETRPTPSVAGVIPPTMEEIIGVPKIYELSFNEPFAIKIILNGEIPGKVKEIKKSTFFWDEFLKGLGLKKGPYVKLEVEFDAKVGAQFYRSIPENSSLLILP